MTQFYSQLPILTEFADIGQSDRYAALPADWHVVMCDVRNSTAAVEAGRYKNVNTVAAAASAAGRIVPPATARPSASWCAHWVTTRRRGGVCIAP